eukprot:snap_masked-scaffold_5-processed-gene-15.21-mRNA-1 protein AED:1.00 eAED:1.00 QI:0/-1/0/0/-1/1/1/0/366
MKKELVIAITGGSGFVADHIVQQLLDDTIEKANFNFKVKKIILIDLVASRVQNSKVEFQKGSITDYEFLKNIFKGVDCIFHCCSLVDFGTQTLERLLHVNVKGTELVCEAAKVNSIKHIVYTSSCESISWRTKPNIDLKETDYHPQELNDFLGKYYGYTKALAEKHLRKWAEETNSRVCSLRPRSVYGEGDKYVLPNILENFVNGYLKFFFGKPTDEHNSMYVGNVAFTHLFGLNYILGEDVEHFVDFNLSFGSEFEGFKNLRDMVVGFAPVVGKSEADVTKRFIPGWIIITMAVIFDKFNALFGLRLNALFNEQTIRSTAVPFTMNSEKIEKAGLSKLTHCLTRKEESRQRTIEWLRKYHYENQS